MTAPVVLAGRAFAIARDVDTDTIIKSVHCTSTDPADLGPHCLAELAQTPGFREGGPYPMIFCRGTFGIGSARIQAPMALMAAGVKAVVASAFAPIFLENCLNGGYLLPLRASLATLPPTGSIVRLTIAEGALVFSWGGTQQRHPCRLPAWALAGKRWMDVIEEQAQRAGGLAALRARGLEAG